MEMEFLLTVIQKFLMFWKGVGFATENMEEILQIVISLDDLKLKRRQNELLTR